ncbi:hypothetical protein TNCT_287211 [Trichonephila clavata]|uniref:CH-like domain-containing protein n=1 Tax=Trichonephila clavata TaxID=2740835 RepID=A0A8X6HKF9_TRICU|nr:hypothetical protein TNCT_287211 [Trichonephila clavata]
MNEISVDLKQHLYIWLKSLPFLKHRNLRREFSDANLVAKLVNFFMPKLALENAYPPCMSMTKKIDNWTRLNAKVLSHLGLNISKENIEDLASSKVNVTEKFLLKLATVLYAINQVQIKEAINQMQKTGGQF